MRKLLVIGIGAGNPDHLTLQAVAALNRADVVFIPDKGDEKADLRRLRLHICDRHIERPGCRRVSFAVPKRETGPEGYRQDVEAWHDRIATQYAGLLQDELRDSETGAFLVWGDPCLYDSTLRIIDKVAARGAIEFDCEVIPGITSVQALAAAHRVALNRIGEPVHITTGRRLAAGLPAEPDSVVVMLDGEQAFEHLDRDDLDILWGAYLGTADEMLQAGPLSAVKRTIAERRAAARQTKGWIMDTYLLRKREGC